MNIIKPCLSTFVFKRKREDIMISMIGNGIELNCILLEWFIGNENKFKTITTCVLSLKLSITNYIKMTLFLFTFVFFFLFIFILF